VATVDVTVASRTGSGRVAGEDRWVAVTGGSGLLLAVADGMGGTVGGADAADAALAGLVETVAAAPASAGADLGGPDLAAAVTIAHERVRGLAAEGMPAALRPGTTLTAALVDGRRLRLAHLGDSSLWLLRRGRLRRLTEEHTSAAALVAAGAVQPGSVAQRRLDGMLTRYAGMPGSACPQLATVRVRPGDRLLVASDGVTRPLPVPQLAALLADPALVAADLVRAAVDAGGRDDATALLAGLPVDTVVPELNTRYVHKGAT
jgi:serine/threonine protein phosphatase PrpC